MSNRDRLVAEINAAEIEYITANKERQQGEHRDKINAASERLVNAHLMLIRSKR